jgi:hypothetical protein
LREEADLAGARGPERDDNVRYGIENYSRRPTATELRYCGLDEFKGKFYICEVKNAEQPDGSRCSDFASNEARGAQGCDTCVERSSNPVGASAFAKLTVGLA